MTKINVYLVDDHKIIRDGIQLMLASAPNINIIGESASGQEAISFLEQNHDNTDIVLVDINMPNMNGIDLTKNLTTTHPNLKILALTMHAEENYIMSMVQAGAHGYILKESGQEELIDAIESIANGKKYFSNEVSVAMVNYVMNENNTASTKLSSREEEVLKLIALGKTNKETGEALFLSARTVETHRRNILAKLECKNTAEMIHYALKTKLISL